jgi:diguanylate cyclase (GGDEF)-like protein
MSDQEEPPPDPRGKAPEPDKNPLADIPTTPPEGVAPALWARLLERILSIFERNTQLFEENRQLQARVRELEQALRRAFIDPLTTLLNLEGLENRLQTGWSVSHVDPHYVAPGRRAQARSRRVAVFILDVGDLKLINKLLGRAGGDELLRQFGATLDEILRGFDIIVRFGGDDFVVVVPLNDNLTDEDCDRQVDAIGHRLRQRVSAPRATDDYGKPKPPEAIVRAAARRYRRGESADLPAVASVGWAWGEVRIYASAEERAADPHGATNSYFGIAFEAGLREAKHKDQLVADGILVPREEKHLRRRLHLRGRHSRRPRGGAS